MANKMTVERRSFSRAWPMAKHQVRLTQGSLAVVFAWVECPRIGAVNAYASPAKVRICRDGRPCPISDIGWQERRRFNGAASYYGFRPFDVTQQEQVQYLPPAV